MSSPQVCTTKCLHRVSGGVSRVVSPDFGVSNRVSPIVFQLVAWFFAFPNRVSKKCPPFFVSTRNPKVESVGWIRSDQIDLARFSFNNVMPSHIVSCFGMFPCDYQWLRLSPARDYRFEFAIPKCKKIVPLPKSQNNISRRSWSTQTSNHDPNQNAKRLLSEWTVPNDNLCMHSSKLRVPIECPLWGPQRRTIHRISQAQLIGTCIPETESGHERARAIRPARVFSDRMLRTSVAVWKQNERSALKTFPTAPTIENRLWPTSAGRSHQWEHVGQNPDEGGTKQTDTPTPANERFYVRSWFSSYVLKFEANVSNNHWQGYAMSVETFRVVFGRVGACCVHIQSYR